MNLHEMVVRTRSFRRFNEQHRVSIETLTSLVDLARLTASAGNLQPLRYIISNDPEVNREIFTCLSWAALLKEWPGPAEGERPSAYIVILGEKTKAKTAVWDMGIAAQTIMLGATESGLGGCILGSINKEKLNPMLQVPDHLQILLVLALGRPREKVILETLKPGQDINYWRDEKKVHHVPKRPLEEILIRIHSGQDKE